HLHGSGRPSLDVTSGTTPRNAVRMLRYDAPTCNRFHERIGSGSAKIYAPLTPAPGDVGLSKFCVAGNLQLSRPTPRCRSCPVNPVQHVTPQGMARREFGVLEVAGQIAPHPDMLHHAN